MNLTSCPSSPFPQTEAKLLRQYQAGYKSHDNIESIHSIQRSTNQVQSKYKEENGRGRKQRWMSDGLRFNFIFRTIRLRFADKRGRQGSLEPRILVKRTLLTFGTSNWAGRPNVKAEWGAMGSKPPRCLRALRLPMSRISLPTETGAANSAMMLIYCIDNVFKKGLEVSLSDIVETYWHSSLGYAFMKVPFQKSTRLFRALFRPKAPKKGRSKPKLDEKRKMTQSIKNKTWLKILPLTERRTVRRVSDQWLHKICLFSIAKMSFVERRKRNNLVS